MGRPLDDQPDPDVFDGAPFSEHADVMSPKKIREVTDYFSSWQSSQQDCTASERREFSEGARTVARWIKGAADVATAPGPCRSSRSAILAWTAEQDRDTARRIFFHESYHAMQNYLLDRCAPILKRNEDSIAGFGLNSMTSRGAMWSLRSGDRGGAKLTIRWPVTQADN